MRGAPNHDAKSSRSNGSNSADSALTPRFEFAIAGRLLQHPSRSTRRPCRASPPSSRMHESGNRRARGRRRTDGKMQGGRCTGSVSMSGGRSRISPCWTRTRVASTISSALEAGRPLGGYLSRDRASPPGVRDRSGQGRPPRTRRGLIDSHGNARRCRVRIVLRAPARVACGRHSGRQSQPRCRRTRLRLRARAGGVAREVLDS